MGGNLSCIDAPALHRLNYDMSPIKMIPFVWLIGPPGSGRNTHAKLLSDNLGFTHIKIADLLRTEADKDTERGKIVADGLVNRSRKIPDVVVIDLIKEDMLRQSPCAKGFLINNFPKNPKQAHLFNKEIGEVDAIIYLICETPVLVQRKKDKASVRIQEDALRKAISNYVKEAKEGVARFGNKLEKIDTSEETNDVYTKIEAAITMRISAKTKIRTESDYAQSQPEIEDTPM